MEPLASGLATRTCAGPFRQAAVLFLRKNKATERYYNRLMNRHGKSKALSIVAKRLGIAVYYMLKRKKPFNMNLFLNGAMTKKA